METSNKKTRLFIYIISSVVFFVSGFLVGNFGINNSISLTNGRIEIVNKNRIKSVDFDIFWDTWEEITSKYLYQEDINEQDLVYGAVKGMVASLGDPYTVFFDPEEFSDLKESMASQYEGIGIEMGFEENQIVVLNPFEGSPADKAGIKTGDYILEIEGETTLGMSLSEAASKIRGEQGTSVKLTLRHKNEEDNYQLEITRAVITYDTVTVEYIDGYAYVRILQFADGTNKEWDDVVEDIEKNKPQGIVLDLRDNGGGYLASAVYIAGDFVGSKVVVKQRFTDGSIDTIRSTNRKSRLSKFDTILLLNEYSASASEILAGALKYYDKVTIVGKKSFGKGIVQDQIPFSESGAGLHVTTSEWLTPGDQNIHNQGISPDVEIELTEEQIKEGQDPQLDKALELLSDS